MWIQEYACTNICHPDSLVQVIKRAHFQTFEWLRCCEPLINHLNLQDGGWEIKNDEVKPVWYTGSQMPPLVQRKQSSGKNRWLHS